jgi:hypothetical protein
MGQILHTHRLILRAPQHSDAGTRVAGEDYPSFDAVLTRARWHNRKAAVSGSGLPSS